MYKVPIFCLVNPTEITGAVPTSSSLAAAVVTTPNADDGKSYSPRPRPPGQSVNLKVRINPGDFNLTVPTNVSDTVLDFKKLVYQKTILENEVCLLTRLVFIFAIFIIILYVNIDRLANRHFRTV